MEFIGGGGGQKQLGRDHSNELVGGGGGGGSLICNVFPVIFLPPVIPPPNPPTTRVTHKISRPEDIEDLGAMHHNGGWLNVRSAWEPNHGSSSCLLPPPKPLLQISVFGAPFHPYGWF